MASLALRRAAKKRDVMAAKALLAHSVVLGHERLAIRRFFKAWMLGATELEEALAFCRSAANRLTSQELLSTAKGVAQELKRSEDVSAMASELLTPCNPLVLPYENAYPVFNKQWRACGTGVSILGRLEVGAESRFGPGSVVRADGHFIRAGDQFTLGEHSTVHIAHERYPTVIGDRVTVGRNAVIHACNVEDDCVIEDDVVILDGSNVAAGCLIEKGSVVFPRSTLNAGYVYSGSPARAIRGLFPGELDERRNVLIEAFSLSLFSREHAPGPYTPLYDNSVFVAASASVSGPLELGLNASVFFGCRLYGDKGVFIGARTNVQDNTVINASTNKVKIDSDVTIGHNVFLRSCRIGARSLIGIGSDLADGTQIDEDVLLAAGSSTLPGQHLGSGWLWAGRPAMRLSRLDDTKRKMMSDTIEQYCHYAKAFSIAQATVS